MVKKGTDVSACHLPAAHAQIERIGHGAVKSVFLSVRVCAHQMCPPGSPQLRASVKQKVKKHIYSFLEN
jgi:hypothetical protein